MSTTLHRASLTRPTRQTGTAKRRGAALSTGAKGLFRRLKVDRPDWTDKSDTCSLLQNHGEGIPCSLGVLRCPHDIWAIGDGGTFPLACIALCKQRYAASGSADASSSSLLHQVSEKITYAKWKATSIAKAFREGKVPTPGPANAEPPLLPAAAAATVAADAHLDAATHDAADTDAAERDEVSRQLLPRQRDEEEFSLPSAPADFATDQGADEERPSLPGVPDDMPTSSKDTYDSPSTAEFDRPPPANHLASAPPADDIPARPSQAQPPPQPPSLPPQQPSAPELPSRPLPLPKPSAPPSAPAPLASAFDEWQPAPANLDPTAIAASQKHAKWAISALNYEDVETAKKELRLALQLIGG